MKQIQDEIQVLVEYKYGDELDELRRKNNEREQKNEQKIRKLKQENNTLKQENNTLKQEHNNIKEKLKQQLKILTRQPQ